MLRDHKKEEEREGVGKRRVSGKFKGKEEEGARRKPNWKGNMKGENYK